MELQKIFYELGVRVAESKELDALEQQLTRIAKVFGNGLNFSALDTAASTFERITKNANATVGSMENVSRVIDSMNQGFKRFHEGTNFYQDIKRGLEKSTADLREGLTTRLTFQTDPSSIEQLRSQFKQSMTSMENDAAKAAQQITEQMNGLLRMKGTMPESFLSNDAIKRQFIELERIKAEFTNGKLFDGIMNAQTPKELDAAMKKVLADFTAARNMIEGISRLKPFENLKDNSVLPIVVHCIPQLDVEKLNSSTLEQKLEQMNPKVYLRDFTIDQAAWKTKQEELENTPITFRNVTIDQSNVNAMKQQMVEAGKEFTNTVQQLMEAINSEGKGFNNVGRQFAYGLNNVFPLEKLTNDVKHIVELFDKLKEHQGLNVDSSRANEILDTLKNSLREFETQLSNVGSSFARNFVPNEFINEKLVPIQVFLSDAFKSIPAAISAIKVEDEAVKKAKNDLIEQLRALDVYVPIESARLSNEKVREGIQGQLNAMQFSINVDPSKANPLEGLGVVINEMSAALNSIKTALEGIGAAASKETTDLSKVFDVEKLNAFQRSLNDIVVSLEQMMGVTRKVTTDNAGNQVVSFEGERKSIADIINAVEALKASLAGLQNLGNIKVIDEAKLNSLSSSLQTIIADLQTLRSVVSNIDLRSLEANLTSAISNIKMPELKFPTVNIPDGAKDIAAMFEHPEKVTEYAKALGKVATKLGDVAAKLEKVDLDKMNAICVTAAASLGNLATTINNISAALGNMSRQAANVGNRINSGSGAGDAIRKAIPVDALLKDLDRLYKSLENTEAKIAAKMTELQNAIAGESNPRKRTQFRKELEYYASINKFIDEQKGKVVGRIYAVSNMSESEYAAYDKQRQKIEDLRAALAELKKTQKQRVDEGKNVGEINKMISAYEKLIAKMQDAHNQGLVSRVPANVVGNMSNATTSATNRDNVATDLVKGLNAATKAHQEFNSQTAQAIKNAVSLDSQFAMLAQTIQSTFSIMALQQFAEKIVQIGGELERQQLAMGSIFGDNQKAEAMYRDIAELSMKSPFDVQDLLKNTKQLSAFGVEYDKLYDTTKRLSDIAAAVGVDFSRIAYEYGQMEAMGYLDARHLRMFSMSGIPLIQQLTQRYSQEQGREVGVEEVRKMISKRQVGADVVKDILREMTDEGGKFYNMQEVMAESLASKWRNFGNAMNLMYGEIAKSGTGDSLKGLAEVLTSLAQNWKSVAHAAQVFIGTMAICKAGMMIFSRATNTADKAMESLKATTIQTAISKRTLSIADRGAVASALQLTDAERVQLVTIGRLTEAQAAKLVSDKALTASMVKQLVKTEGLTFSQKAYIISLGDMTKAQRIAALHAAGMSKWLASIIGVSKGAAKAIAGIGTALRSLWAAAGPMVAVTAISAALAAWEGFNEQRKKLENNLNDIEKESNKNRDEQIAQIDILVAKIGDENLTQEEKLDILRKLQSINPEYFKGLEEEADLYKAVADAAKLAKDAIKQKAQNELVQEKYKTVYSSYGEKIDSATKDFEKGLQYTNLPNTVNKSAFTEYVRDAIEANPNISLDDLNKSINARFSKELKGQNPITLSFGLTESTASKSQIALEEMFNLAKKRKAETDKILAGATSKTLYADAINEVTAYYDELIKKEHDQNKILDLQIRKREKLKEVVSGTGNINYGNEREDRFLVGYEDKTGTDTERWDKEILELKNQRNRDWAAIAREVVAGKRTDAIQMKDILPKTDESLNINYYKRLADDRETLKANLAKYEKTNSADPGTLSDIAKTKAEIEAIDEIERVSKERGVLLGNLDDFRASSKVGKEAKTAVQEATRRIENLRRAYEEYKKLVDAFGEKQGAARWQGTERYKQIFGEDIKVSDLKNILQKYKEEFDKLPKSPEYTELRNKLNEWIVNIQVDYDKQQLAKKIAEMEREIEKRLQSFDYLQQLIDSGVSMQDARRLSVGKDEPAKNKLEYLYNKVVEAVNAVEKNLFEGSVGSVDAILEMDDETLKRLFNGAENGKTIKSIAQQWKQEENRLQQEQQKLVQESLNNLNSVYTAEMKAFEEVRKKIEAIKEDKGLTPEEKLALIMAEKARYEWQQQERQFAATNGILGNYFGLTNKQAKEQAAKERENAKRMYGNGNNGITPEMYIARLNKIDENYNAVRKRNAKDFFGLLPKGGIIGKAQRELEEAKAKRDQLIQLEALKKAEQQHRENKLWQNGITGLIGSILNEIKGPSDAKGVKINVSSDKDRGSVDKNNSISSEEEVDTSTDTTSKSKTSAPDKEDKSKSFAESVKDFIGRWFGENSSDEDSDAVDTIANAAVGIYNYLISPQGKSKKTYIKPNENKNSNNEDEIAEANDDVEKKQDKLERKESIAGFIRDTQAVFQVASSAINEFAGGSKEAALGMSLASEGLGMAESFFTGDWKQAAQQGVQMLIQAISYLASMTKEWLKEEEEAAKARAEAWKTGYEGLNDIQSDTGYNSYITLRRIAALNALFVSQMNRIGADVSSIESQVMANNQGDVKIDYNEQISHALAKVAEYQAKADEYGAGNAAWTFATMGTISPITSIFEGDWKNALTGGIWGTVQWMFGGADRKAEYYEKVANNIKAASDAMNDFLNVNNEVEANDNLNKLIRKNDVSTLAFIAGYQDLVNQRMEIQNALAAEEANKSKDRDEDAIREYKDQIKELNEEIAQYVQNYVKEVYSLDIYSWAEDISDALVEAFQNGEDAAEKFADTVNSLLQDVAKDIVQKIVFDKRIAALEEDLYGTLNKETGVYSGGIITEDAAKDINGTMQKVTEYLANWRDTNGDAIVAETEAIYDYFDNLGIWDSDSGSSTSASIQGITEETADILAAYINGMRGDLSVQRGEVELIRLNTDKMLEHMLSQSAVDGADTMMMKEEGSDISSIADNISGIYQYSFLSNEAIKNINEIALPEINGVLDSQLEQLRQQTSYLDMINRNTKALCGYADTFESNLNKLMRGDEKLSIK